jgi:acyl carrier protein
MTDDIEQQVVQFIRGLKPTNVSADASTDLLASGMLDSLAMFQVVTFVSERFSVAILARDLTPANLRTPRAVTALIKKYMP